jgi:outer membrane protein OmpA-like peptidoglycan-associated protein
MNLGLHAGLAAVCLLIPTGMVGGWTLAAGARLEAAAAKVDVAPKPVAQASDVAYCSTELKDILKRVLSSCGLLQNGQVRGCQPLQAKNVAAMSNGDFNALFLPMAKRAGIIQFDQDSAELDAQDNALLDKVFSEQQGASYFFVVARSSPEGSEVYNRDLSQRRGEAVLAHLRSSFKDEDLDKEVGLLWLGEEYAQLDDEFCTWQRSGASEACQSADLNRSAFVAWIDCTL